MKVCEYDSSPAPSQSRSPRWLEKQLLRIIQNRLQPYGTLHLTFPSGFKATIGQQMPEADLQLHSFRPLLRLLFGGINGWSEGYLAAEWDSNNLTALVRWAIRAEQGLAQLARAGGLIKSLHNRYHRSRDNNRAGSRRNIAAHYDLGNDFYRLWLDESMSYSAALFSHPEQPLIDAQANKYNRVLELLNADAKPNAEEPQHIVEIGCGWGGFAVQASRDHNLTIHGITLSEQQLKWAQQQVQENALEQQVHLSLSDYRDLNHQYDGVVSIEMFEAVGEAHWDSYFTTLKRILKPDAKAVLQIITIADERFAAYRQQADFIQRYVFPGGMLPSVSALHDKISQHGFELIEQQHFGQDYADTLVHWHERFEQNWPQIQKLGFDQRFYRLWRYYLAYCEGGFREGTIDVGFYSLRKKQS